MVGYRSYLKSESYLKNNNLVRIGLGLLAIGLFSFLGLHASEQAPIFLPIAILVARPSVLGTGLGVVLGLGLLYWIKQPPGLFEALLCIVAVVVTFPITAIYHGASHLSLKPKWLNRWLGEVISAWHLSSLDEWSIVHAIHHAHSDDPKKDPHPPAGKSFFEYLSFMPKQISKVFGEHFIKTHGPEAVSNLKKTALLIQVRQVVLSIAWLMLLGPKIFVCVFATNIVFKKLHYVWFNWATHVQEEENQVVIKDNNQGLYKLVNAISFNLYNHAGHHKRPNKLSPSALPEAQTKTFEKSA